MPEEIKAHITGVVFQITAKPGDRVAAGDAVIVLESMKMEIPRRSARGRRGEGDQGPGRQTVRKATWSPCWNKGRAR
jgi:hypothetical protein